MKDFYSKSAFEFCNSWDLNSPRPSAVLSYINQSEGERETTLLCVEPDGFVDLKRRALGGLTKGRVRYLSVATMGEEFSGKRMIATQEEMVAARVPLGYRDQCAHLLIPLNKCRVKEYYLPWKCENERHTYEKCEYELFMERVKKMEKIRKEAKLQQKQPIPLMPDHAHA